MGALTKADIAENLVEEVGLSKKDSKDLVESFFDVIRESLIQREQVKLSGFGNFEVREKSQRPGRNPKTGEEKWRYKNYAPLWGGVLSTAGNLVFMGNPEGYLMAFDAVTGDMKYKFNTGSGIVGSPITWEMEGEQYISVVSGWGGAVPLWGGEVAKRVKHLNQGGSVWTFKLPKES